MNKPNLYNFFEFIKNKTGKVLEKDEDWVNLKFQYSPDKLTEKDLEKAATMDLRFNKNLPQGFPNGATIKNVSLSGDNITAIPASLSGIETLNIYSTPNLTSIPPLQVNTLQLYKCEISEIPENTEVDFLFLDTVSLQQLPRLRKQSRLLALKNLSIDSLTGINARTVVLEGGLPNLKQLPENFSCEMSLHIRKDTAITELPKGLNVGWDLTLECNPPFDTLPDDLQVENNIIVNKMPTNYPEHLKAKIKVKEKDKN